MTNQLNTVLYGDKAYTRHAVSTAYGHMKTDEYEALKKSLTDRKFDADEPVLVLPDDHVIDGWHRLLGSIDAGVEPLIQVIDVTLDEVYNIVRGKHLGRRNQSARERAESDVKAKLACGMEFAETGRPPKRNQKKLFTKQNVAEDAGVSTATAQRAISRVKSIAQRAIARVEGEENDNKAPPKAKRTKKEAATASGTEAPPKEPTPAEIRIENLKEDLEESHKIIHALESALDQERSKTEKLAERVSLFEKSAEPETKATVASIMEMETTIAALRSELAECKHNLVESQREVRSLKSKITKLNKQLEGGNQ